MSIIILADQANFIIEKSNFEIPNSLNLLFALLSFPLPPIFSLKSLNPRTRTTRPVIDRLVH